MTVPRFIKMVYHSLILFYRDRTLDAVKAYIDITLKSESNSKNIIYRKGKISNPRMTLICDRCEIRIRHFRKTVYMLFSRQRARFNQITASKPLTYNVFSRIR